MRETDRCHNSSVADSSAVPVTDLDNGQATGSRSLQVGEPTLPPSGVRMEEHSTGVVASGSGPRERTAPGRVRGATPPVDSLMDLGRLLLRLTIGTTFFVHGTQKLRGWFGGYGPDGTGQFFESLGLRPGRDNAVAAGATEAGCGVLIALGLERSGPGWALAALGAGAAGSMIVLSRTEPAPADADSAPAG